MESKRWLLINPPTGKYIRETRCQAPVKGILATAIRPPLDLAYIAACVSLFDCECKIIDYPAEGNGWNELKSDINTFKPDYVVVNTTTFTITEDLKACKLIKEVNHNIITLAKGAIFYAHENNILQNNPVLDIAVIDDDEVGFSDIASGKPLSEIPGIIYRYGEQIVRNRKRKHIDLDKLPLPRRDLLKNELYIRPDTNKKQTTILVGRGCDSYCTYCIAPLVGGHSVRYRSVESVIVEVKYCIENYNIKDFYFLADNFTWDKQWVISFCEKIVQLGVKISWTCNSRVDCLDEERLISMKKSGCWGISMGVESGSQQILDKIKKGISLGQVKESVLLCKKYSMVCLLHFIIGFPWDNYDTVNATIKFASSLKWGIIEFNILVPLPGTPMEKITKELGLMLPKVSLESADYSVPVAQTMKLNSNDLMRLRRKAFFRIYGNPGLWIRSLKLIKSLKQFCYCVIMLIKKLFWIFNTHLIRSSGGG